MKTVSLELSKQLKEAGYPQTRVSFYYVLDDSVEEKLKPWYVLVFRGQYKNLGFQANTKRYASPTADEILDLLPSHIRFKRNKENKIVLIKNDKEERITDKSIYMTIRKDYDSEEYLIEYYSDDSFLSGGSNPDLSDASWSGDRHNTLQGYRDKFLANCAALMWLHLKKEGLI